MDSTTLTTLGVPFGAAYISQLLTNWIKGIIGDRLPLPQLTLPMFAFGFGIIACAVYGMAEGLEFNKRGIAKVTIQGFFAAAGAIAGTEMHKNARTA